MDAVVGAVKNEEWKMTTTVEALWLRLQAILKVFADRFVASNPTLILDIGRTANDNFMLRGYLAVRRRPGGDEIAITIDVRSDGQRLALESDACSDDGRVVAAGPSAAIALVDDQRSVEAAIGDWLRDFERFLIESEQVVALAAFKLR
jgi:hypothetical protein